MTKKLLIFFLVLAVFSSCKKTKGPEPENNSTTISTSNPNAVSSSIRINNSQKLSGTPPAPSNSPQAPVLPEPDSETIKISAGKTMALNLSTQSGQVSGAYVQVKGSEEYYKVTLNSGLRKARKGNARKNATRIASSSSNYLPITLPSNISTGTFCFQYCVFDSLGRVSNIIEKCVEVVSLGGNNATFLTANTWEAYKYKYYDYDSTKWIEEPLLGKDSSSYTSYVVCENNYTPIQVYSVYNTRQLDFIFQQDGAGKYIYESEDTDYDYNGSTCDSIKYTTEVDRSEIILGWSYDDATKKLIIIFDFDESEDVDPEALEFTVTLEGNEMLWYDAVLDETYYLRKK